MMNAATMVTTLSVETKMNQWKCSDHLLSYEKITFYCIVPCALLIVQIPGVGGVEPRELEDFEVVITSLTRPRLLDELFLLRMHGGEGRGIGDGRGGEGK